MNNGPKNRLVQEYLARIKQREKPIIAGGRYDPANLRFDRSCYYFNEKVPIIGGDVQNEKAKQEAVAIIKSQFDYFLEHSLNPKILVNYSISLRSHGYIELAEEILIKAMQLGPENPDTYHQLIRTNLSLAYLARKKTSIERSLFSFQRTHKIRIRIRC